MELSMSASCFFVESSIVDWELLGGVLFDVIVDRMMDDIGIFGSGVTKVEGYGQRIASHLS
jgi:hypothetical protein